MNWFDNTIAWFSPQAGLRRARARAAQQVILSYEGARTGRRFGGNVSTSSSSGNAEMGPAIARLRDNAEDLARNNSFANKSVRRWCRRVVGYGITPQADTRDAGINAVIDRWWNTWVKSCCSDPRLNFYAAQRQIVRTAFTRGECLVRLWDRPIGDGLPVPFQIQVQEPDYLDTAKTQWLGNAVVIHGVQFDLVGRLQGFWLFGQHPGDPIQTSLRGSLTSKFIPAQYLIHHVPLERPGDVRGVSRFAAVISKLRDLDEYADAEIVRKKIEACLAMFVGQPEGLDGPKLGPITTADGQAIEQFEPGMIAYGQTGQKPEFFSPTTSGDYAAHKKVELREIFSGLDQPYVVLGNDLSDVNYSSFRGGAIDERDSWEEYRWLWLIPQVLDPIWAHFIDKLYAMGEIPEPNYGVKWNPPAFDLLDRAAEAEADRIELQIGKTTWPKLVGEQGEDPEKQIQDISRWKPRLDAAGVTFAKSTTESTTEGANQNAGNNQAAATED
jgi:lambda family phage portal protein